MWPRMQSQNLPYRPLRSRVCVILWTRTRMAGTRLMESTAVRLTIMIIWDLH